MVKSQSLDRTTDFILCMVERLVTAYHEANS